ncbi:MAG: TonB-dependent receptor plug domain-containing protein [Bacteroidales bacterium]|nr:TonB-dependent receptor plug domain-containing protein [Bacteroidales bacterium]
MKHRILLILAPSILALAACGTARQIAEKQEGAGTGFQDEVIDIGYGTSRRKDLGFAVNKVEVDDVTVRSYQNIAEYLRSRVPGIDVNPNGTINIRGQKMLSGPAEALIVVDGIICDNLDSVAPNDIHSVQVLKDGSASIYGSRGGGGVVLITTKMAYEEQQAKMAAKKAQKEARKASRKKN